MIRCAVATALLLSGPTLAQDTIETDSEEGQAIIAAAEHAVGDCLATSSGNIVPNAEVSSVACDDDEATHRVAEIVIDPFECPEGTGRLMQYGPDNATFCIGPLDE